MKHLFAFSIAFLAIASATFTSCNKGTGDPNANFSITELLTSGSWKISYYFDGNTVRSDNFSGYTFNFQNAGKLNVFNNAETVTGNWDNQNSNSLIKLLLNNSYSLSVLSKEWSVTSTDNTIIYLECVNGAETCNMQFTKI